MWGLGRWPGLRSREAGPGWRAGGRLAAGSGLGVKASEPAAQPCGARWCFRTAGKEGPGSPVERLGDKGRGRCVWAPIIGVGVICDVNTF